MIEEIKSDLIKAAFNNEINVLIHQANCFNIMGAGFAKLVKENFPEAYYEADLKTKKADFNKLGNFSYFEYDGLIVINLYGQYKYGPNTNPEKVKEGLEKINTFLLERNIDFIIGMPKIGSSIGGYPFSKTLPNIKNTIGKNFLVKIYSL